MIIKEINLSIFYFVKRKVTRKECKMNFNKKSYREFTDISEAEQWGKQYYGEWAKVYKNNMYLANGVLVSCFSSPIECYCGYLYRQINKYLRFKIEESDTGAYEKMAYLLAISLVNAPRIEEDIIVYRLVSESFIKNLLSNHKKGIPTIEKGFISTSLLKNITENEEYYANSPYLIKLYVKKQTIGIYVPCIANRETEQEMLLFPNGYFKIIDGPYRNNGKTVYECELFYFHNV